MGVYGNGRAPYSIDLKVLSLLHFTLGEPLSPPNLWLELTPGNITRFSQDFFDSHHRVVVRSPFVSVNLKVETDSGLNRSAARSQQSLVRRTGGLCETITNTTTRTRGSVRGLLMTFKVLDLCLETL